MANAYCTALQIKEALPDVQWDSARDTALTKVALRASRAIDRVAGLEDGAFAVGADTTRYFTGKGVELRIGMLAAVPTSVAIALSGIVDNVSGTGGTYTALATTDYWLEPFNAAARGKPYRQITLDVLSGDYSSWFGFVKGVKVVGMFGYSTTSGVPEDIIEATIIQAMRYYKRGQAAFAGVSGSERLGKLKHSGKLDPDIALIVVDGGYRRLSI
jgi:hypothetical protein